MNIKMVLYTLGRLALIETVMLILPIAVCFMYGESQWFGFAVTAGISLVIGIVLSLCTRRNKKDIYAKEGFAIVAFVWISMAAIGALPFTINGEIPNYVDALFETVSGFTTTGASILRNVEAISHGGLFWRSFTHWIGGMGVLVLITAITPSTDRSMHILKAEMPGPIFGKLVPRMRDTAKILYIIYIVLTLAETVMLICGGMSVFEGFVHAFGTAGTGGFGIKGDSIGGYNSYCQWVIAIFMILFGVNFNLYYMLLIRRFRSAVSSVELWVYLGICVLSSAVIAVNIYPIYGSVSDSVRLSVFQTASIVTTTGYATADFNLWPALSKSLIFVLMFLGGCAGSTAGGLKVSRAIILFKLIGRELRHMLHPRSVNTIKHEGKRLDGEILTNVSVYFALYMVCILGLFLVIGFEPFGFETNFTAAVSCFNNVGPGLANVGPAGSYADYSMLSKLALTFGMLLGRLEIFPLLIALSPSTWTKK